MRQHRFVPTKKIVKTMWYCLAVVAQKYRVQLHGFMWMSNHYHLALTDPCAELPDFMRDLNALISKAINAVRGMRGENFSRLSYNAVIVADDSRLLRHCAYAEANPCRAHLVDRAQQWTGVSSAKFEYGQNIEVRRPKFGLWKQSPPRERGKASRRSPNNSGRTGCPEVATMRLVPPPCMAGNSPAQLRARVRSFVRELENTARKERKHQGIAVLGMRLVRRVHHKSSPENLETYFGRIPRVSGEAPHHRASVQRKLRAFISRYRQALNEYKATGHSIFPEGTWWMRRYLNRPCYACSSSE